MDDRDLADRIRLHLAAAEPPEPGDPAQRELTALGIGDAVGLDQGTVSQRVRVLSTLQSLVEAGHLEQRVARVAGYDEERNVYVLTDAGRERAREAVGVDLQSDMGAPATRRPTGTAPEEPEPTDDRDADGEAPERPFVGRADECGRLREVLDAVPQRGSHTVLVAGEAGVGKTALLSVAIEAATERGYRILDATAQRDVGEAYGVIRRALAPLGEAVVGPLADAEGPTVDDPQTLSAQREARRSDVAAAVRESAADSPLLVAIDDLQWADRGSRALFAALAGAITEWIYPVCFLATYRPGAVEADEDLAGTVADLRDGGRSTHLDLGPLDRGETRTLVAALAGVRDVPQDYVGALQEETGGNPLFVTESVKHQLETGQLDPTRDRFPDRAASPAGGGAIADVIEERLEALDRRARELLELGSVIGEAIPRDVLAEASELAPPDRRDYVDAIVASQLWERRGPDTVGFVATLVQQVIYDRLADRRRQRLHGRVAGAIESVHAEDLAPHRATLARHYEGADEPERALENYVAAGDRAASLYAHEEAIETYETALSIAERTGEDRVELLEGLGAVLSDLGRYDEATERLARARDLADDRMTECRVDYKLARVANECGDIEGGIEAVERGLETAPSGEATIVATLEGLKGDLLRKHGELDAALAAAEAATEAATAAEAGRTAAVATRRLGNVHWGRREYERARECFERSLDRAREIDYRKGISAALNNLGAIASEQHDMAAAEEYFEQSLAMDRERGDRRGIAIALMNLGHVASRADDHEGAERYYREGLEKSREIGDREGVAVALNNLAAVARYRDEYERAADLYRESLEVKGESGLEKGVANGLFEFAELAVERGNLAEAETRYRRSRARYRETGDRRGATEARGGLGRVHYERGEYEAAREVLAEVVEELLDAGDLECTVRWAGLLVRACRDDGDLAAARQHGERVLEAARNADATDLLEGAELPELIAELEVA